jgi:hypothetical protein
MKKAEFCARDCSGNPFLPSKDFTGKKDWSGKPGYEAKNAL